MSKTGKNRHYLVIGGGGFLGRAIVEQLLARGETRVSVFDLRDPEPAFDNRVTFIKGDLTNKDDCERACTGVTTVIHTASPQHKAPHHILLKVNVGGTKTLLEACRTCGVRQLVLTSSASVVFCGRDLKFVDETQPYPTKYYDYYSYTKQLGEQEVLKANGVGGLLTCVLRPSGIFGPRDVQFWPEMIKAGREGKTKVRIGDGKNLNDFTFVENAAQAHLLAADKLEQPGSAVAGQVYFVTNGEPIPFWDHAIYILSNFGGTVPKFGLPYLLIYYIMVVISLIMAILTRVGLAKEGHPYTPERIALTGSWRTFSIKKAKRDLGYEPKVPMKEALDITRKWFKQQEAGSGAGVKKRD